MSQPEMVPKLNDYKCLRYFPYTRSRLNDDYNPTSSGDTKYRKAAAA